MIPTRISATIVSATDLSATAREVTLRPQKPIRFLAGSFVNLFLPTDGGVVRRAYSISSDPVQVETFTISVRRVPQGLGSTFFWQPDVVGKTVEVMGPLGRNTSDKLTHNRVFLFGFGIGVSVIKALAHYCVNQPSIRQIVIMTGNRNEEEVLYRAEFEHLAATDRRVVFHPVLSNPLNPHTTDRAGFIQQHVHNFDFTNSSIYLCGQPHACTALQDVIHAQGDAGADMFVESF